MIIEIFGLPGAGKTTVVDGLRRVSPSIPLIQPPIPSGLLTAWSIFILCGKVALLHPLSLIRLGIRGDGRWLLAKLGYRMAGRWSQAKRGIVVDSGVLQPLLSYAAEDAAEAADVQDVLALLDILPLPHAILYVDVPAQVAYERYLFRQAIEGVRSGVSVSLPKYVHAQMVSNAIVGRLGSLKILRVKNVSVQQDHELLAMSQQLSDWVEEGRNK